MVGPTVDKPLFLPGAPTPLLLSPRQAAYLLNIDQHQVLALLNSGLLTEKRIDGYKNHRRHITLESVMAYSRSVEAD